MGTNNYQELAKDFMNIWQKQMATVVSDKQFIHAMLDMFQNFQNQNAQPHTKPSTAHASHASDDDAGMLARIAFRLEMCERRLAALETDAKSPARPKKPAKRAAAGRTKGSKRPRK